MSTETLDRIDFFFVGPERAMVVERISMKGGN